jgi:hypothetical protein
MRPQSSVVGAVVSTAVGAIVSLAVKGPGRREVCDWTCPVGQTFSHVVPSFVNVTCPAAAPVIVKCVNETDDAVNVGETARLETTSIAIGGLLCVAAEFILWYLGQWLNRTRQTVRRRRVAVISDVAAPRNGGSGEVRGRPRLLA